MNTTAFDASHGISGNGAKGYHCCLCDTMITYSDRVAIINGTGRHFFKNPLGVECDFYTFSSCPGAVALGEATDEYTWFSGYQWSLALCGYCGNHMGWFYERSSAFDGPSSFWGLLVAHLCEL